MVQFDATRETLPGFDMFVVVNRKGNDPPSGGSGHRCCMVVVSSCREMLG